MKSEFFSFNGRLLGDADIVISALKADIAIFSKVIDWYDSQKSFPDLSRGLINAELIEKFELEDPDLVRQVVGGIALFLNFLSQGNDSFDCFVDDLKSLHADDLKEVADIDEKFSQLQRLSEKYRILVATTKSQSVGGADLTGMSFSVALKPIIFGGFDYHKTDIAKYQPNVFGLAPIVMAEFINDNKESITFQLKPSELDDLVNRLLAIKIELEKVEEYLDNGE